MEGSCDSGAGGLAARHCPTPPGGLTQQRSVSRKNAYPKAYHPIRAKLTNGILKGHRSG